jgi:transcriptional regulator with XRE-family HTH domain
MVLYAPVVVTSHGMFSPSATGARVRELRGESRYTQADLAAAMSSMGFRWHQNTVFRVEKGRRQVTLEEAAGLAAIFCTPLDGLGRAA